MATQAKPKPPRPGDDALRPTNLVLTEGIWKCLQAVERETGASPSWTARQILSRALARRASSQSGPAA